MPDIASVLEQQRRYFASGATFSTAFRIEQLNNLKALIALRENDIVEALQNDLRKSAAESLLSEIMLVKKEIDYIIKNLATWMRPEKVRSLFPFCWPGRSTIYFEPYGSALIIGAWNYPFLLTMGPLLGALAAGNCAVVKPPEMASHTQNLICDMLNSIFPAEYIYAVKAGPELMPGLLEHQFDYIFFTGGTETGKIIMQAAAKHLTPVTLELGGKSPCIVDASANLDYAARRIAWGKWMNAGQTCIAPDYVYVHQSVKQDFLNKLAAVVKQFYGDDSASSQSYPRIINKKHFARITRLMQAGKIITGGSINEDQLYIAPTIVDGITWQDPVMQEEIFGPVLPVLEFQSMEDVIRTVKTHPKPLALYLFTNNAEQQKQIMEKLSFGGGCINDCLMQVINYYFPFGGVGASGLGGYHGKYSFETFSHRKSVFKRTVMMDVKMQYPPYDAKKLKWLRRLLRA